MINLIIYIIVLLMAGAPSAPVDVFLPHFAQHGGITFYYNEFEGQWMKCKGYRYEQETGPWLAVDISEYEGGKTKCGDWHLIIFYDGSTQLARALDSGYLKDYEDGVWDTHLPFVADLPKYWRNGKETRTGTIVNLSATMRNAGAE